MLRINMTIFFVSWLLFCDVQVLSALDQEMTVAQTKLAKNDVRILNTYCKKCHGDGLAYPGLEMSNRAELLAPSNGEDAFVVPGDPEELRVWSRVVSSTMPPAKQPQPSAEEKAILRKWIKEGAMFPQVVERSTREFVLKVATPTE